ncbi:MAG: DUF3108 domain-containing protein [Thermodesulfobacteriota bacterium]
MKKKQRQENLPVEQQAARCSAARILWGVLAGVVLLTAPAAAFTPPDPALLAATYQGGEVFRYAVSWLGIPAGELEMRIEKNPGQAGQFFLRVTARTTGVLDVIYPVEDRFVTVVEGERRLPLRCFQDQQERGRLNRRLYVYDQQRRLVTYMKNDNPPEVSQVDGPVHNEFSAFFYMRSLHFAAGEVPVVPTFADKKRHEVEVFVDRRETIPSLMGDKATLQVRPHLTFKGYYEKMGDPQIWLTDDQHRIPLLIKAKIIIGSLTGRLIEYQGPLGSFKEVPPPSQAQPQPIAPGTTISTPEVSITIRGSEQPAQ